jgi:inorganic triphosphatase YgiF
VSEAAAGHERPGARPTETEVSLVVVSGEPEEVVREAAALRELDGIALEPRPDEALRDTYFDTPDRRLADARRTLRIREVGARRVLTLKGSPRPALRVGVTREELEEEWPEPTWALLRAEFGLGERTSEDPVEALEAAGFVVIQERETLRRVRDVVPMGETGPVAELALDTVVFHLDAGDVRHHELEVEVKAPGGDDSAAALAGSLALRFGPSLRLWPYGKLTTGRAVSALIAERGRDDLVTADGTLRRSAYDAIDALLAGEPS